MRQIPAAKLSEQCLTLLDAVDHDGIVIIKHGKPVAQLIPYGAGDGSLPLYAVTGALHA